MARRAFAMASGAVALAAAMTVGGCARSASDEPSVGDAVVRLAAVPGRPAGAYFTLHGGAKAATVTGVSTPAAQRAELHESRMTAGGHGMTMDPLPRVPLPAGGTVRFAPAGKHVMLFDLSPDVKPGGTVTLTFALDDGHRISAPAKVIAAGDPVPGAE